MTQEKDNSVPNRIYPRKQPGLYMIRCIQNDLRYYGESSNVSGRLASHRSLLNRQIHPNKYLQSDWNLYAADSFEFTILYMGDEWEKKPRRLRKETKLIIEDPDICYNFLVSEARPGDKNPFWGRLHTEETKQKIRQALKGRPNNLLGKKILIHGTQYPSIAEASRQTGIARKTIRKKLEDAKEVDYVEIDNSGKVERPS